jgi:hypothetical protein
MSHSHTSKKIVAGKAPGAEANPPQPPDSCLATAQQEPVEDLAARCQALEKLFWLAARDVVFFSTYNDTTGDWDDGWHPAVNLNDTFCYACADAAPVRLDELDLLIEIYRRFGDDGVTAWAAQKRKADPIPPHRTEAYHAASRYLAAQDAPPQVTGDHYD